MFMKTMFPRLKSSRKPCFKDLYQNKIFKVLTSPNESMLMRRSKIRNYEGLIKFIELILNTTRITYNNERSTLILAILASESKENSY